MSLSISRLFLYPVKSLRPVEVNAVEITGEGLRFDRSFILVSPPEKPDEQVARHITIKKEYRLILFQPEIDKTWSKLSIRHTSAATNQVLTVPLTPSPLSLLHAQKYRVSIFGTSATGLDMGKEAASFFSQHLEQDVRLLFIGGSGHREIPGAAFIRGRLAPFSLTIEPGMQPQRIRFADAAPLLVTTTASENETRSRLPTAHQDEDIIIRLRPNIHIAIESSLAAWDEDAWATLIVHSGVNGSQKVTIKCIFNCVRCLSLNADPDTGQTIERDRQLYGHLAQDRRISDQFPQKPVFGRYAFAGPVGAFVRTGDKVEVSERQR